MLINNFNNQLNDVNALLEREHVPMEDSIEDGKIFLANIEHEFTPYKNDIQYREINNQINTMKSIFGMNPAPAPSLMKRAISLISRSATWVKDNKYKSALSVFGAAVAYPVSLTSALGVGGSVILSGMGVDYYRSGPEQNQEAFGFQQPLQQNINLQGPLVAPNEMHQEECPLTLERFPEKWAF